MKIVIIEDENELGVLMRNFLLRQLDLKSSESAVMLTSTLSEGLRCIKESDPDWIFIDNNLPDGKGIDNIIAIKKMGVMKRSRIVMMSAMTNLRDQALRIGVDYFMEKPISFEEIRKMASIMTQI
ncbi:response regulator [Dyadobacter sandarakinus]|uniref:Response regulator n=1 Tax=Dyadobacter sandarakinus TaxID=2747268 RepID=A0ABX7IC79_9BACT|nr:response regulator [Dyadobacter sandarakinus]QRR03716.1 response regulator [Dyadobacter sandarakinus]